MTMLVARGLGDRSSARVGRDRRSSCSFISMASAAQLLDARQAGIDPPQTGKITSTLSAQGISYELQNNGTASPCSPARRPRRASRSPAPGVLATSSPASRCSTTSSSAQSNFQQQVTYQRALRGPARPDDRAASTASPAPGRPRPAQHPGPALRRPEPAPPPRPCCSAAATLDAGAVRGIAQLVASSVPGLSSTRSRSPTPPGTPLWPTGQRRRRRRGMLPSRPPRSATTPTTAAEARRDARADARRRQGPGRR